MILARSGDKVLVLADDAQIKDARLEGMARVFRLMEWDGATRTFTISEHVAVAAGFPVDAIKARR